jgi:serine/threonine-protein kinase RsbT
MPLVTDERLPIRSDEDVVMVRQRVRALAVQLGFSLVEQTKIVTAASELGRNTLVHGKGGTARLELVNGGGRKGLKLTFEDHGPGITDMALAMRDGYTTGTGMGLGLGGAKRLCSDFEIWSKAGEGTRVTICRWK